MAELSKHQYMFLMRNMTTKKLTQSHLESQLHHFFLLSLSLTLLWSTVNPQFPPTELYFYTCEDLYRHKQPCLLKKYVPIQGNCILNYVFRETYFPVTGASCKTVAVLNMWLMLCIDTKLLG